MNKSQYKELAKQVEQVQDGNQEAFGKVYEMTYQRAYFYALQLVKQKELAEEVVQDVYLNAMCSINTLMNPMAFIPWLTKSIYYQCIKVLNKEGVVIPVEDEVLETNYKDENHQDLVPEMNFLKQEKAKEIMKAISSLSLGHKNVVLMHYYQHIKLKDIAETLNCSVGTVKSRLNTAKKNIKDQINLAGYGNNRFLGMFFPFYIKHTIESHSIINSMSVVKSSSLTTKLGVKLTGSKLFGTTAAVSIAGSAKIVTTLTVITLLGVGSNQYIKSNIEKEHYEPVIESVYLQSDKPYINTDGEIRIKVNDKQEIKEMNLVDSKGAIYSSYGIIGNEYIFYVDKNDTYTAKATGYEGHVEKSVHITSIDKKGPTIEQGSRTEDEITIRLIDGESGIDYDKIQGVVEGGKFVTPIRVDKNTNTIVYENTGEKMDLTIYDNAGNSSSYSLTTNISNTKN